ncbi:MAG: UDP-N-acetylmuramoyl-tripeptide--D-alanyl-D-alanine ligase [Clostridia bacterium]|nr:UDP-N-acetylmuramoyl-tripeptide--D-alanyl-D-alanine ligase [Clostridia bacterium]
MREFTLREIEEGTRGRIILGDPDAKIKGLCIDSRKYEEGNLFFAIKGNVTDGHKYIKDGMNVVVSDESAIKGLKVNAVLVTDTTKAMADLARYYLKSFDAKKVCVTGSVGKTSTRDMVYYVLSQRFKTGRNIGNLNSEFGIPMMIMSFDPDLEAMVLEVGMDHFGEIDKMVHVIEPDIGIITNVGVSHIENLGSREGILKAKMEITNCFDESSLLIVNGDNDLLTYENTKGIYRLKRAGQGEGMDALVENVRDYGDEGIQYDLTVEGKTYDVRLYVPGGHNAINSALAILAGLDLGIKVEDAIEGLQKMELTGKRLKVEEKDGIKVINDTYNACPDSMKSALNSLVSTKGERKVAILGDMYELGEDSAIFHRQVGEYAAELSGLDVLISVGELGKDITAGAKDRLVTYHYDKKEDLYKDLDKLIKKGDVVLVKSSNGLHTETIVEELLK